MFCVPLFCDGMCFSWRLFGFFLFATNFCLLCLTGSGTHLNTVIRYKRILQLELLMPVTWCFPHGESWFVIPLEWTLECLRTICSNCACTQTHTHQPSCMMCLAAFSCQWWLRARHCCSWDLPKDGGEPASPESLPVWSVGFQFWFLTMSLFCFGFYWLWVKYEWRERWMLLLPGADVLWVGDRFVNGESYE